MKFEDVHIKCELNAKAFSRYELKGWSTIYCTDVTRCGEKELHCALRVSGVICVDDCCTVLCKMVFCYYLNGHLVGSNTMNKCCCIF